MAECQGAACTAWQARLGAVQAEAQAAIGALEASAVRLQRCVGEQVYIQMQVLGCTPVLYMYCLNGVHAVPLQYVCPLMIACMCMPGEETNAFSLCPPGLCSMDPTRVIMAMPATMCLCPAPYRWAS